ncbi:MAG: cyclic nucleotide-binding domain-containing protein [Frankiales bacterium]|nr:cyclic nucleotide-binding domain-containing protein [Frankiales bacterium]
MAEHVKTADHPVGKMLAEAGQDGVAFHLLGSRPVQVLVARTVVTTLGPGDYVGELALIDGQPRSGAVRTTSPSPPRRCSL